jgi:S-DNA-T family DNA segregation ATPase FtsK/SpoIIIE
MQVFHSDVERVESLAADTAGQTGGPEPILRLATEIDLGSISGEPAAGPVVGVGGPEYQPFSLDFSRMEPHLVIAGEGRSGRSTALLTIFEAVDAAYPEAGFVFLSPRPSPVRHLAGKRDNVIVATAPADMIAALEGMEEMPYDGEDKFLVIDDAESLPAEVGDHLERRLRDANQTGLRTFVAGRSTDLSRSFEGWVRYLLSLKSGLVLMPAPDGGFIFDVRLPALQVTLTPGRGFFCDRGETTFVQIALPSGTSDRSAPTPSTPQSRGGTHD